MLPMIRFAATTQGSMYTLIIDQDGHPPSGWGLTVVNFQRQHLLAVTLHQQTGQPSPDKQRLYLQYVIDIMGFGKIWHMGCYLTAQQMIVKGIQPSLEI